MKRKKPRKAVYLSNDELLLMKRKSPILALAISLATIFIPLLVGLGQFYNGQYRKGLIFLAWGVLTPCLAVLISDMLEGLSLWACYIYAAIDAYRSAKRINEQINEQMHGGSVESA